MEIRRSVVASLLLLALVGAAHAQRAGPAQTGDPCSGSSCAKGTVCAAPAGASFRCIAYCSRVGGSPSCAAGTACTDEDLPEQNAGVCE